MLVGAARDERAPGAAALDRDEVRDDRADGAARHASSARCRSSAPRPAAASARADLELAESLASRAAAAVENSRLYQARSAIARTLQASLLPPALPDVPGFELAAAYRAAGEGFEVGGDFYDVFSTAEDQWYVVIGDVCGKGAEAAAVTAMARYTIRAAAVRRRSPAAILRLLGEAMMRQEDARAGAGASARSPACTSTSRARRPAPRSPAAGIRCRRSCAPTGAVEELGVPGTLLGLVERPELQDSSGELHAGDTVVLYTDGLTEAGAPEHVLGPAELGDAAARRARAARRRRSSTTRSPRRSACSPSRATTSRCSRCARPDSGASAGGARVARRLAVAALAAGALALAVALRRGASASASPPPSARRRRAAPRGSRRPTPAGVSVTSCARGSRPLRPCGRPSRAPRPAPPSPRPCAPRWRPCSRSDASSARSPAAFLTRPVILSVMPMVGASCSGLLPGPTRRRVGGETG